MGETSRRRIRVAVLFGGQSEEHDVSLRSARTVIAGLDPERYEVVGVGITRGGQWLTDGDPLGALIAASPMFALMDGGRETAPQPTGSASALALRSIAGGEIDVVFPVLHGPMGEDGTIQGLFELLGIPYVGSGVLGSAVGMDKIAAKMIFDQQGIPQARWRWFTRADYERDGVGLLDNIANDLRYPLFVKPANMGSSVGIAKARHGVEFAAAVDLALRHDRRVVVEAGIDARELEISVLGNDEPIASVAGEIVPGNEFYDYAAKYLDDTSRVEIPAQIDAATLAEVQRLAVHAFRALDLAGLARVDFFLERGSGRLLLNEVNTMPGFTSISMYPMLWAASGMPLEALVSRLIDLALERAAQRQGR
jgi:D-alanine-D-alanine ligase